MSLKTWQEDCAAFATLGALGEDATVRNAEDVNTREAAMEVVQRWEGQGYPGLYCAKKDLDENWATLPDVHPDKAGLRAKWYGLGAEADAQQRLGGKKEFGHYLGLAVQHLREGTAAGPTRWCKAPE